MLKKISAFLSVIVVMAALLAIQAAAANITIMNNLAGTPDTVQIDGVNVNDIIRVYSTASTSTPIGVTIADSASMTFYINQLGTGAGSAYISVTPAGAPENVRTEVAYLAEPKTDAPVFDDISDITIVNVAGRPDSITISNLADKDIVRVYPNSVSTIALGTVVSTGTSASFYINQLGVAAGTVYITVQGEDALESARTAASYASETSVTLDEDAVTVVNNFYTLTGGVQPTASFDTITVKGVADGDTVTVYKALIGNDYWVNPITLDTDDIVGGEVKFDISQLGIKAGKVYVTIMTPLKAESKRAPFIYLAEPVSDLPAAGNVTVTNNYNDRDIVDVTGLVAGDIFTVYNAPASLTPIGSDTVGTGETTASASINDGDLLAAGGKIYVTVTSPGKNESGRVAVTYKKEDTNAALAASKVEVTNNYNIPDTMKVTGLTSGDIIKVYTTATSTPHFVSATAAGTTEVSIPLGTTTLLAKGGNIYVTLTTLTKSESPRTPVSYKPEKVTVISAATTITVVNNYTASDTVTVTGLTEYDEIRVYALQTGGPEIGFKAVAAGATSATADIANPLLSPTGGKIYVSVKSTDGNESARKPVTYLAEATTGAPANIVVFNNYNTTDSIIVSGVAAGDVVKIYAAATGTALISTSGTVAAGETSITFAPDLKPLSATGGKIYVSVKIPLANESPRTAFTYTSEKSLAPVAKTVTVQNNYYVPADATTKDTIRITGVEKDDTFYIYKASGGNDKWAGPVTAAAAGSLDITIDQLGSKAGNIFITVIKKDKSESTRTSVVYTSEPVTKALTDKQIIIDNRFVSDDIVTVNGLTAGQIVTVYATTTGPAILTPVTVTDVSYTIILDDGVLAANGGKLYVSVKNPLELESTRTALTYTSETTVSPKTTNILVVNYPGTAYDTVTLVGLTAGDIIKIYDKDGAVLVTATVPGKGTTLTLDANLPDAGGTIYVTVTNDGKAESKKVAVTYHDA